MKPRTTLTEAKLRSGLIGVQVLGETKSLSSFRNIPYRERYRASSSAILETPIEYLQQAARDEAKKKSLSR